VREGEIAKSPYPSYSTTTTYYLKRREGALSGGRREKSPQNIGKSWCTEGDQGSDEL